MKAEVTSAHMNNALICSKMTVHGFLETFFLWLQNINSDKTNNTRTGMSLSCVPKKTSIVLLKRDKHRGAANSGRRLDACVE